MHVASKVVGEVLRAFEVGESILSRWRTQFSDMKSSVDGNGRAIDNVMIERLWRTVKYEEVTRPQPIAIMASNY